MQADPRKWSDEAQGRIVSAYVTIKGGQMLLIGVYLPHALSYRTRLLEETAQHVATQDVPTLCVGDFNMEDMTVMPPCCRVL